MYFDIPAKTNSNQLDFHIYVICYWLSTSIQCNKSNLYLLYLWAHIKSVCKSCTSGFYTTHIETFTIKTWLNKPYLTDSFISHHASLQASVQALLFTALYIQNNWLWGWYWILIWTPDSPSLRGQDVNSEHSNFIISLCWYNIIAQSSSSVYLEKHLDLSFYLRDFKGEIISPAIENETEGEVRLFYSYS